LGLVIEDEQHRHGERVQIEEHGDQRHRQPDQAGATSSTGGIRFVRLRR
jgi:RecG-like helicase